LVSNETEVSLPSSVVSNAEYGRLSVVLFKPPSPALTLAPPAVPVLISLLGFALVLSFIGF